MSHIWMQHTEHKGKAEIPTEAADMWALKGWVPCEAPVDADPAMVEHQPIEYPVRSLVETREDLGYSPEQIADMEAADAEAVE